MPGQQLSLKVFFAAKQQISPGVSACHEPSACDLGDQRGAVIPPCPGPDCDVGPARRRFEVHQQEAGPGAPSKSEEVKKSGTRQQQDTKGPGFSGGPSPVKPVRSGNKAEAKSEVGPCDKQSVAQTTGGMGNAGEAACSGVQMHELTQNGRACPLWLCFAQRRDTTPAAPTRGRPSTGSAKRKRVEQSHPSREPSGGRKSLAERPTGLTSPRSDVDSPCDAATPTEWWPARPPALYTAGAQQKQDASLTAATAATSRGGAATTPNVLPATRQLHLDLGQANFAFRRCPQCGLVYAAGNETDERLHAEYHRRSLEGIKFKETRGTRTMFRDHETGGRIVAVLPGDPESLHKQVRNICAHVEKELGTQHGWLRPAKSKVFLYVSSKQQVLGLALMDIIRSARHLVLASSGRIVAERDPFSAGEVGGAGKTGAFSANYAAEVHPVGRKNDSAGGTPVEGPCDSTKHCDAAGLVSSLWGSASAGGAGILQAANEPPVSAVCGIRAVWVAAAARRKQIASKLLDSARCECLVGYVVPRKEVAFFHPTADGQAFATRYTGINSFLVYGF